MKDGICPKCGSKEIYTATGKGHRGSLWFGWTNFGAVTLQDYVCADCGYMEQYILNRLVLEQIRQKWERADGQPNEKRKR